MGEILSVYARVLMEEGSSGMVALVMMVMIVSAAWLHLPVSPTRQPCLHAGTSQPPPIHLPVIIL